MPHSYNLTQRDIGLEALYCQDFDDLSTYFLFRSVRSAKRTANTRSSSIRCFVFSDICVHSRVFAANLFLLAAVPMGLQDFS